MSTAQQKTYQQPREAEDTSALEAALAATQSNLDRADLMQLRMENEMMMAECRSHPRDFAKIRAELTAMLDAFPDFAYRARYCKPVGEENGVQKYARGLSIRAAETLAEAYKYNSIESEVVPLGDGLARVTAAFMDFQNGRKWRDSGVISQWQKQAKAKGGGMYKVADDRFYGLVCKAEVSRRIREVILRTVNSALREWFEAECIKRAAQLLTEVEVRKIIDAFKGLGATLEQIENRIGRPVRMGWTEGDRVMALEIWNAISDGETTAAEAFGLTVAQANGQPETPVNAQGAVSGDDLAKPKRAKKADKPAGPPPTQAAPPEVAQEPPPEPVAPEREPGDEEPYTLVPDASDAPDMDEEMFGILESRVGKAKSAADCNAVETEIKKFPMSTYQRARLMSKLQAVRKEASK